MLTDDAFARLVAEDVKNKVSGEQRSFLRLPENLQRWKRALEALLSSLDDQIDDLNDREKRETHRFRQLGDDGVILQAEMQTDIDARRRKINGFRFYVEARLDEVERMVLSASDSSSDRGRTAEFLRLAIQKHKQMLVDNDFDYTEIDEALWATLEGFWNFDNIDLGV